MIKGYKAELDPNKKQIGFFRQCAGASRFVFNWGLARWQQIYEDGGKPSAYSLRKEFNAIKDEQCSWIRALPYAVIEVAFYDLGIAFQNFFRRVKQGDKPGYPKFKKHNRKRTFAVRSAKVKRDRIRITHLGWVRLKESDYIPVDGEYTTYARFSERAGRWYVAINAKSEIEQPELTGDVVGIDLGLKTRAVFSNGVFFDAPKATYEYQKKLARAQRELSRRKRAGKNWQKTKRKVQIIHAKIADVRKHWLHQISHYTTHELKPSVIVLEDLNVSGMVKNHHLAKAVSDAGFFELRRQIEYKADWLGIEVVIADRWFASSKTCSGCGWKNANLTLADRVFKCPECGLEIDRDLNAAQNLAALVNRQTGGDCLGSCDAVISHCEPGTRQPKLDIRPGCDRVKSRSSPTVACGSANLTTR